jgi:hypothetical protein
MQERHLTPFDRFLSGVTDALRTVAVPAGRSARENPAEGVDETDLDARA